MDKENDIKRIIIVILAIVVALGVFVTVRSCTKKDKDDEVVEKEDNKDKDKDDEEKDVVEDYEEVKETELVAVVEEPDTLGLQDCYIILSNITDFSLPTVTLGQNEVLSVTYKFQSKGTNGYVDVDQLDSTKYGIYKVTYTVTNNGKVVKQQVVTIVINEPSNVDTSVLEQTIVGAGNLIGEFANEAGITESMNTLTDTNNRAKTLMTSPLRTQEQVDQMIIELNTARVNCLNKYDQLVLDAIEKIMIVEEMNENPTDSTDPEKTAALLLAEEKIALIPSGMDKVSLTERLEAITNVEVETEVELNAAISNVLVKNITLIDDITLTNQLLISGKTKVIDGDGHFINDQPVSIVSSDIEFIDVVINSQIDVAGDPEVFLSKVTLTGTTQLTFAESLGEPALKVYDIGETENGVIVDNRDIKVAKSIVNGIDTYYYESLSTVTLSNDRDNNYIQLREALSISKVTLIKLSSNVDIPLGTTISADHRTVRIESNVVGEFRKIFYLRNIVHGENLDISDDIDLVEGD